MAKTIMRAFKINEISGVDTPAQEGAKVVLMKRKDGPKPSPDTKKRVSTILTSVEDGHQHGLEVSIYDKRAYVYLTYAKGTDDETEHTHPIAVDSDGSYQIGMSSGHTHSVDGDTIKTAILNLLSKTKKNQGDQIMDDENKKRLEKLKKELARATEIIALKADERRHFDGLVRKSDQDAFLAKDSGERQDAIEKAANADPVVYTTTDGLKIRKSDGAVTLAMAKQNDRISKENAELRKSQDEINLRKQAGDLLKNCPGSVDVRVALVKAVNGIEDEEAREGALKILKAGNSALSKKFKKSGVTGGPSVQEILDDDSPESELDKKAKELAKSENITYSEAYAKVLNTDEGKDLYAKSLDAD